MTAAEVHNSTPYIRNQLEQYKTLSQSLGVDFTRLDLTIDQKEPNDKVRFIAAHGDVFDTNICFN